MQQCVGCPPRNLVAVVVAVVGIAIGCSTQSEIVFTKAPFTDLGEIRRFIGHEEPVTCLAISRDGKRLLSGCGRPEIVNGKPIKVLDTSVRLWDVESGEQIRKLEGHTATVESVALSPDGKVAASASNDGTIRIWDLETGLEKQAITGHKSDVYCVVFFPTENGFTQPALTVLFASGTSSRVPRFAALDQ